MYNSKFRIYTIPQIEEVVIGKHIDPTFSVIIDDEHETRILNIGYPYFQKPSYIRFDLYDEEEE